MIPAISAEMLKLRTLLLPRAVLVLAAMAAGLIGYAMSSIAIEQGDRVELVDLAASPARTMWFLVLVVGVLAAAGEFQHRTVRTTLLQAPGRGRFLAAKAVVAAAYGALVTLVGLVATTAVGVVVMRSSGMPVELTGQVVGTALGSVAIGALWGVLATAVGVAARNSTVALVAVLVWQFVGEGVVPAVTRNPDLAGWLPGGAAAGALSAGGSDVLLPPVLATLLFAAYAVAAVLAGWLLVTRRDPA